MEHRRLVAVAAMVTLAVGVLRELAAGGGLPGARFWISYGIAFTLMSIAVDLGSGIGAGLALLFMVAMTLQNGGAALDYLREQGSDRAAAQRGRQGAAEQAQSPLVRALWPGAAAGGAATPAMQSTALYGPPGAAGSPVRPRRPRRSTGGFGVEPPPFPFGSMTS